MQILCRGADETFAVGDALGRVAVPGTVVLLQGDLGAGKTVFARGLGAGLAVKGRVQSPTFVIVQSHAGRLPFWHADLYRLAGGDDLEQLGLDDLIAGDGVVAIEWPDRLATPPADVIIVRLEEMEEGRRVTLAATGPRHQEVLDAFSRVR
jgi:tRNA threonylcarbamoyladenosine biosynthesis protein TsaE